MSGFDRYAALRGGPLRPQRSDRNAARCRERQKEGAAAPGRYYNRGVPDRSNDELVDLLLACHVMRDAGERAQVLSLLGSEIGAQVPASGPLRDTVAALVLACTSADALDELLAAVREREGPSVAMFAVDIWFERARAPSRAH